jgi:polyribonucleotide nucleotidyltransferase
MATICAISLALIQAGVTLKNLVAGVAMGLLKDEKRFCILTDIGHREDMFGDLDFKVGGTKKGINAIQMDISADIDGITLPIIIKLLKRARQALDLILEKMEAALTMCATSTNAPKMKKIQVDPKKIKFIIGKGGATIKNITKTAGVSIDVKDDGTILVFGDNDKNIQTAIDLIELQVKDKELTMNKQYSGKIVRILPYGVFINLVPGRDAFMNIKKIKEQYGEEIKEGMQVEVILTGIDENGKLQINLVK